MSDLRDLLATAFAGVVNNRDDGTWAADTALEVIHANPDVTLRDLGGQPISDEILDHVLVMTGIGPHECEDGWFWIAASRDVIEPLTDAERHYFEARKS